MTELIIDGIQAVLPQSFTIQVKRENPLITKNGEYTYDVTLDLSNSINADLYKHLNRLNSVAEVKTKRSAILMADNRVYCNGTEVITGWTDKSVTIQIASGNSELNYIIGGDREIASLTTMPVTDPNLTPLEVAKKNYPDINYCIAPVVDKEIDTIANDWGICDTTASHFLASPTYAQPFLCAYMREVAKALGYTFDVNQVESTPFATLYICQVANSSKWCEMLPQWTVLDFFNEVEKFFNGVFVVDNRKKTISFLLRSTFFFGLQSVHVQSVEDVYELEVDEEPSMDDMADSNISYKLDDADFWRFHRLSDTAKKMAKFEDIPLSFAPDTTMSIGRARLWFKEVNHQSTITIYNDVLNQRKYLFTGISKVQRPNGRPPLEVPMFRAVDDFATLYRAEKAAEVELQLRPVTFETRHIKLVGGDKLSSRIEIPVIMQSGHGAKDLSGSLPEIIANNESTPTPAKNAISLAFYEGLQLINPLHRNDAYPLPFIDEFYRNFDDEVGNPAYISSKSLKLSVLNALFYQSEYNIDFKKGVKITSYDPNVYNPRNIFEIRNKRYICADIEYTLSSDGRKGAWTGTFYPIKISDTAADARWILTEGLWRDGGVWLDNGRWLDD